MEGRWPLQNRAPIRHYHFLGREDNDGGGGGGGPAVRAFFDEATNTVSYLAWDPATKRGAVIDPVLDWDNRSGEAHTGSADAVLRAAEAEGWRWTGCWKPMSMPTT